MPLFAKYWALCIAWSSKVQPSHSQRDIHVGKVHIKSINNLEAQLSDDTRMRSRVLICALIPVTSDRVVFWAMWAATLHSMLGEHIVTVSAIINAGDDDHSCVLPFYSSFPLHSHSLRPEFFTDVSQIYWQAKPQTGESRDSISELLTPASASIPFPDYFLCSMITSQKVRKASALHRQTQPCELLVSCLRIYGDVPSVPLRVRWPCSSHVSW